MKTLTIASQPNFAPAISNSDTFKHELIRSARLNENCFCNLKYMASNGDSLEALFLVIFPLMATFGE